MSKLASLVSLSLLVALTSCAGSTTTSIPVTVLQWVVGWGTSPQNASLSTANPGGNEQTFRFIVLPTVAGTEERVHFSNYFGTTPLTIGAARLALAVQNGPGIDPTHDAALTFSGSPGVTLAPGQELDSDPVSIAYTYGQQLAVTMYLKGSYPPLTQHNSQFQNNYATLNGAGDTSSDASGSSFSQVNQEWFAMTGVEVLGPYVGTVAILGSSPVDGHNANFGDTNAYPVAQVAVPNQNNDRPSDYLARSLQAAGINAGVLNAGLLGDPAAEDASTASGQALAGIDRMQHDVLSQPGIKAVIIYMGGIDLRSDCKSATQVEATLTSMVQMANAAGVRVILASIPPSNYCVQQLPLPSTADPYAGDLYDGPENYGSAQRRMVNTWIRTQGAQLPGVVSIADFDAVLADPAHPDFMIPNLNSGDNFHPDGVGYGVQNSAINISSIFAATTPAGSTVPATH